MFLCLKWSMSFGCIAVLLTEICLFCMIWDLYWCCDVVAVLSILVPFPLWSLFLRVEYNLLISREEICCYFCSLLWFCALFSFLSMLSPIKVVLGMVLSFTVIIFFKILADSWYQDSFISINGETIKLCSFKCRCKSSTNCLCGSSMIVILGTSACHWWWAFLFQVLPEFLQVEAFAKLSNAIGMVSWLYPWDLLILHLTSCNTREVTFTSLC